MQYFGGKSRTGQRIAEVINGFSPLTYYEPFCGGLWVTQYVKAGVYLLSDNNPYLITLYRSLQDGWEPPECIDEAMYRHYQQNPDDQDPLTAFIGIGCSFSGKWFGGYARNKRGDNYAGQAKRSLLKKFNSLPKNSYDCAFDLMNFSIITPNPGSVVYCDPPYQDTTNGYSSEAQGFWETMREWSKTCTVIISEYKAPEDFMCIEEFPTFTEIRGKTGRDKRIERLFMKL